MTARVLIVDDEPATVEFLEEFLAAKGYAVITAGDGAEALRKVKEERPHAILLDIKIPKVDGLDVLRQLKALAPTVNVIIVTATTSKKLRQQALALGAFECIVKPLDLQYLEMTVSYAITMSARGWRALL